MSEYCKWCGNEEATDAHHLFRRSTSPQMREDPANIVKLGPRCHRYATENQEFEQLLQEYFFLRLEREELTVAHIAGRMKLQDTRILSPADTSRFRSFLAGERYYLAEQYNQLEMMRPFKEENFRKEVESDTRARNRYQATSDGIQHKRLSAEIRQIDKMLSALRSIHENYQQEARHAF